MSSTDELNTALSDLQSGSADIEACAVVSEDELIIASFLLQGSKRRAYRCYECGDVIHGRSNRCRIAARRIIANFR